MPSLITLGRVLRHMNVEELERVCSRFHRELDGACSEAGSIVTQQGERLVGQALDGKTVRGASTPALNHYQAFPATAQVVRRTRCVTEHSRRKTSVATEYLITSLDRDRVALAQVEVCRRGHWTNENVTHYSRDESFGEDRSQVRAGNAPQALAVLRNAIAALLRIEGWTTLPAGFRYCRASPQHTLQM